MRWSHHVTLEHVKKRQKKNRKNYFCTDIFGKTDISGTLIWYLLQKGSSSWSNFTHCILKAIPLPSILFFKILLTVSCHRWFNLYIKNSRFSFCVTDWLVQFFNFLLYCKPLSKHQRILTFGLTQFKLWMFSYIQDNKEIHSSFPINFQ